MGEIIMGLLLILLSLLIYTHSDDLPSMNESQLDAGSFPQIIAILLGILSLLLVLTKTIKLIKERQAQDESPKSIKKALIDLYQEHKLVLLILSVLFIYIVLVQVIGFIISSIAFMIVTALIIGPKTKKDIILISSIAVILTVGLYMFFQEILKVRFPTGLFF
ncbi:tripartite tricarboxylate transporter TctB family protein [Piscibacillus halophilus]|uniref:tripartite tricarboxylate transporter TctB family protein n=1 Tax=Piscibacillus halophilus TaxID=571933 RepID=UPI000B809A51|nr:tripartite tricarboxylate transporter TctB family protein [Piscibacillus halophilus]